MPITVWLFIGRVGVVLQVKATDLLGVPTEVVCRAEIYFAGFFHLGRLEVGWA